MAKSAKKVKITASRARIRFVRVGPRKMRLVADLVRGKTVAQARNILKFTRKPSAVPHIVRLLKTAVANAIQNNITENDADALRIGEIQVDSGPMLKRMRPRAFGRGATIRKRMSHVSIVLTQK